MNRKKFGIMAFVLLAARQSISKNMWQKKSRKKDCKCFARRCCSVGGSILMAGLLSGCVSTPTANPAVTVNSDEIFSLSLQADEAYEQNRWIEAAHHYKEMTRTIPLDPYAWFRLGNTHTQQGDYGKAIKAYEHSIARNNAQPKPWYNLATAYLLNAQIALRESLMRLRPDDPATDEIEKRLALLNLLVFQRVEEATSPAEKLSGVSSSH